MAVGKDYSVNKLAHRKLILNLFKHHIGVGYTTIRKRFVIGTEDDQIRNCIDALNALKAEGMIQLHTMVYSDTHQESKYYLTKKGLDAKL